MQLEKIAISECCRGHKPIYIYTARSTEAHCIILTTSTAIETSELLVGKNCTRYFFRYCFRSNFLTVCRNEVCNIPLKSYGLGATSTCWTLFEIPHGLRVVLKMVRPMTSGSEHFFLISSKPLVGTKEMIHRWKYIIEAHLFHIYYVL